MSPHRGPIGRIMRIKTTVKSMRFKFMSPQISKWKPQIPREVSLHVLPSLFLCCNVHMIDNNRSVLYTSPHILQFNNQYGMALSLYSAPTTEPTSEPTRNCDLLDIDEFLTDCSVEWDNAGNVMSTMATSIETNAASITAGATAIESNAASIGSNAASIASNVASIQSNAESIGSNTESIAVGATSIASNTESIGKNTAAIASNAAAIQSNAAMENRIAALEHIMDQLDVNHAAAKYAPGNVDVVAPVSGMSDGINLTVKDIGILVLMAMNMVMIAIMVITCKRQSGRRKYQVVSVGSDIEPINA